MTNREIELKRLQQKRAEWEDQSDAIWKAFCKLLVRINDDDLRDELTKSVLNYGIAIRRREWANEEITQLLLRPGG